MNDAPEVSLSWELPESEVAGRAMCVASAIADWAQRVVREQLDDLRPTGNIHL